MSEPAPPTVSMPPFRRKDDMNPMAFAMEFMRKNGAWATVAGLLIYWMATTLQNAIVTASNKTDQTLFELRQHGNRSDFYAQQQCINTAVLAGTPRELCVPPPTMQPERR